MGDLKSFSKIVAVDNPYFIKKFVNLLWCCCSVRSTLATVHQQKCKPKSAEKSSRHSSQPKPNDVECSIVSQDCLQKKKKSPGPKFSSNDVDITLPPCDKVSGQLEDDKLAKSIPGSSETSEETYGVITSPATTHCLVTPEYTKVIYPTSATITAAKTSKSTSNDQLVTAQQNEKEINSPIALQLSNCAMLHDNKTMKNSEKQETENNASSLILDCDSIEAYDSTSRPAVQLSWLEKHSNRLSHNDIDLNDCAQVPDKGWNQNFSSINVTTTPFPVPPHHKVSEQLETSEKTLVISPSSLTSDWSSIDVHDSTSAVQLSWLEKHKNRLSQHTYDDIDFNDSVTVPGKVTPSWSQNSSSNDVIITPPPVPPRHKVSEQLDTSEKAHVISPTLSSLSSDRSSTDDHDSTSAVQLSWLEKHRNRLAHHTHNDIDFNDLPDIVTPSWSQNSSSNVVIVTPPPVSPRHKVSEQLVISEKTSVISPTPSSLTSDWSSIDVHDSTSAVQLSWLEKHKNMHTHHLYVDPDFRESATLPDNTQGIYIY